MLTHAFVGRLNKYLRLQILILACFSVTGTGSISYGKEVHMIWDRDVAILGQALGQPWPSHWYSCIFISNHWMLPAEMATKWQATATAGLVANVAKKEQPHKNWLDIKRCYLKSMWRTWDETAGQPSTDWSGDYVCSSVCTRAWEELAVMISK